MSRKINVAQLDKIIKRTIRVINESKSEIYEIAESSRRECKGLKMNLKSLRSRSNS